MSKNRDVLVRYSAKLLYPQDTSRTLNPRDRYCEGLGDVIFNPQSDSFQFAIPVSDVYYTVSRGFLRDLLESVEKINEQVK